MSAAILSHFVKLSWFAFGAKICILWAQMLCYFSLFYSRLWQERIRREGRCWDRSSGGRVVYWKVLLDITWLYLRWRGSWCSCLLPIAGKGTECRKGCCWWPGGRDRDWITSKTSSEAMRRIGLKKLKISFVTGLFDGGRMEHFAREKMDDMLTRRWGNGITF